MQNSNTWTGIIGFEGKPTGDGRLIKPGALTWDVENDNPLVRLVVQDVGAHGGAQTVGRIFRIWRGEAQDDGSVPIYAEGDFDSGSDIGKEAMRQVSEKLTDGVSMDLDGVTFEERMRAELAQGAVPGEEDGSTSGPVGEDGRVVVNKRGVDDQVMYTTEAHIRGVTLVSIPAFRGSRIQMFDSSETATDTGTDTSDDIAIDDNFSLQEEIPADDLEFASTIDLEESGEFAKNWVDQTGGLPSYVRRISKHLIQKGMDKSHAIATAVNVVKKMCATGDLQYPGIQHVNIKSKAEACAAVARWEGMKATAKATPNKHSSTAATAVEGMEVLEAAAAPVAPPIAWFRDPALTQPTPLTITEDGQVYGHLATWGVCHTAQPAGPGTCTTAPHSPSGYARFHNGTLQSREGQIISVGKITMGTGHAGPKLSPRSTLAHYDNNGTAVADVRCGEDSHGIWVAGALRPGVTDEQVRALRASPLSGDWRRVDGHLELHAALAVNVPGFPIPHPAGLVASGEVQSLVATGMLPPDHALKVSPITGDVLSQEDATLLLALLDREKARQAQEQASERESKLATMAARLKVESFASRHEGGE